MIKKMTDEILDNPKERDAMQKSQDEVSACKFDTSINLTLNLIFILISTQ